MINLKKASLLATLGLMLVPATVMAGDHQVPVSVKDSNGNVVTSSDGNCVITKWTASSDACGKISKRSIESRLSKEQRTVYFEFNKSTLTAKEKKKLDEVAKIIKDSKEVESVDIAGYADTIGKASYNKSLSTRRAEAVKAFLATKGLKTRKVHVEGLGESTTASCSDIDAKKDKKALIACLQPDRRVEIELNVK